MEGGNGRCACGVGSPYFLLCWLFALLVLHSFPLRLPGVAVMVFGLAAAQLAVSLHVESTAKFCRRVWLMSAPMHAPVHACVRLRSCYVVAEGCTMWWCVCGCCSRFPSFAFALPLHPEFCFLFFTPVGSGCWGGGGGGGGLPQHVCIRGGNRIAVQLQGGACLPSTALGQTQWRPTVSRVSDGPPPPSPLSTPATTSWHHVPSFSGMRASATECVTAPAHPPCNAVEGRTEEEENKKRNQHACMSISLPLSLRFQAFTSRPFPHNVCVCMSMCVCAGACVWPSLASLFSHSCVFTSSSPSP